MVKISIVKLLLLIAAALLLGCNVGFFSNDNFDKCGEQSFTSSDQICEDGVLKEPCGAENNYPNPATQFCLNGVIYEKCSGFDYDIENQICEYGIVKTKCGINDNYYDPTTQFCYENDVFDMCLGEKYDIENQICDGEVIKNICGNRDNYYDPAMQICSGGIIYDKVKIEDYKTVTIGSQTWMAENIREDIPAAKCYDNDSKNCELFGMLYDWNTANTICPVGWHLPDDGEWNTLQNFVENGTKLRANSPYWIHETGTDDYGFTALPSGYIRDSKFSQKGEVAGFWSATTGSLSGSAHLRFLTDIPYFAPIDLVGLYINNSMAYVRCIKD